MRTGARPSRGPDHPRSVGNSKRAHRLSDRSERWGNPSIYQRPCLGPRFFFGAANQLLIGESAPRDVAQRLGESRGVVVGALVEPERLLVKIPEQVERLDADVRAANRPLQK